MFSEDHVVFHMDDVHSVVWVIILEELQDFELNTSLIVVLFLVLYDLQSYMLLRFMVKALDGDTKRSTPQVLNDLVAIGDVVLHHDPVVAFGVVIATVIIFLLFSLLLSLAIFRRITPCVALVLASGGPLRLNLFHSFTEVVYLGEV